MKAISVLFLLSSGIMLLLGAAPASAQETTWMKTYGGSDGDFGNSVQQTTDGGYIVAGETFSYGAGTGDIYLIKTDAAGDTLWTKTYGGSGYDWGNSVDTTTDGGYIVVGEIWCYSSGWSEDVYMLKTDAAGDTLWTKTYGGSDDDCGFSVQQTTDGGYIVAGSTYSYGAGSDDVYLLKMDAAGDTLWTKTYGGSSYDWGYSVQQTTDSGYIVTGGTGSYGAGVSDVYLIKTDAAGDTLWTKTYGGSNGDWGYSVQQTTDSGYIVTGGTGSYGAGLGDVYLLKTNAEGDTLWTKTYGGSSWDVGTSVQQTTDSGYIVTGVTVSYGADSADVYLLKTNAEGDTLWTKTYGGSYSDGGYSVQQTTDGGYIVAGSTYSSGTGSSDVYLIKTDADGVVGVADFKPYVPLEFAFPPPHPNPFNPSTVLSYELRVPSRVRLDVYNVAGGLVTVLLDTWQAAGNHRVTFDGSALSSGIYLARLTAGESAQTQKLVLLK